MKRSLKKLRLMKETLSILESQDLIQAHGGNTNTCLANCGNTANCTLTFGGGCGSKTPSCVPNGCTNEN